MIDASSMEWALLRTLMQNPENYWKVNITSSDFYGSEEKKIFQVIVKMAEAEKPTDPVSLADIMGQEYLTYLARIYRESISGNSPEFYAQRVKEEATRRSAHKILTDAVSSFEEKGDVNTLLADTQSRLESITHADGKDQSFEQVLSSGLDAIDAAALRANEDGIVGAPTGIRFLDNYTGGWWGAKLWIVAARPSVGKSAFALQCALNAASKGHAIGICSLEMDADEIAMRAMANRCRVNMTALSFGRDKELSTVVDNYHGMPELPIWVDDSTYSLNGIVARISEWKRKHNIQAAVVDHIGLVEAKGANRVQQLGEISRTLKKLTKRLGIPVIALSQLNRSSEIEEREPRMSDLRESGNLEQDANVVVAIHAVEPEKGDNPIINFGVLKNRGGKRGWVEGRYEFVGAQQTFREINQ